MPVFLVGETIPLMADGLKCALDQTEDLGFAGSVTAKAWGDYSMSAETQTPIIIFDLDQSHQWLLATLALAQTRYPGSILAAWYTSASAAIQRNCMKLGVRGFLNKRGDAKSLVESLRKLVSTSCLVTNGSFSRPVRNSARLTPREQEVVELIRRGMKNRQIAEALRITTGTVKVHLMHIFQKIGVKDRFELAISQLTGQPEAEKLPLLQ